MKIVGNCEYGLIFDRERLPKLQKQRENDLIVWIGNVTTFQVLSIRKIHPTQKPVKLIEKLIEIFTDEGDVVIDPCAGSGSTLIAAANKKEKVLGLK